MTKQPTIKRARSKRSLLPSEIGVFYDEDNDVLITTALDDVEDVPSGTLVGVYHLDRLVKVSTKTLEEG